MQGYIFIYSKFIYCYYFILGLLNMMPGQYVKLPLGGERRYAHRCLLG